MCYAVQRDALSDDVSPALELARPQGVAQHEAAPVLRRPPPLEEGSSERGIHAERFEELRRDHCSDDAQRLSAPREVESTHRRGGQARVGSHSSLHLEIDDWAHVYLLCIEDLDDLLWLR